MAPKNLRFVWGTPPVPAGRWHGGLVNLKIIPSSRRSTAAEAAGAPDPWHDYRRHRLHLSLRGLLAWGAALAFVAYFAGAAVLHQRLERASPHNRIGYLDLALPTRWSGLERLRGQAIIDQGRAALAEGRFNEGLTLLRLGLARHPADHDARLALAQAYVALRLAPQAEKLLRDGLAHGYPGRASLEFAFALAADADYPARWVELAQLARERFDALPSETRPAADSLWLDQQQVRALLAADLRADALTLAEFRYPEAHPFRRELAIVARLETGRAPEAASLAEAWAAAEPRAPEPLRLLARARGATGEHAAMDAALERLRALDPANPEGQLYALAQHHLARRADAAQATLENLLLRHGASPALYPPLASLLVELNDAPALERLARELDERGLSPRPVLWARLQQALNATDWPALLRTAEQFRGTPGPALNESQASWLDTATHLARACLDPGAGVQASLVEAVADKPGSLRLYTRLIDALLAGDRPATARQILTLADGPFPASRTLAALRPRIDAAIAAIALPDADSDMDVAVGDTVTRQLASAESFETEFSGRIRRGDTAGALALLSAARRARPVWLAAAEPRLDAWELPLRARGDDALRLRFLARSALLRDPAAPAGLLALARSIATEAPPRRDHAILLVREILRHDPADPAAAAQLAAWEPPPVQETLAASP